MGYSRLSFSVLCVVAALPFLFVSGASAQEAEAPPPSKIERFGTWSTRCQANAETGKDVCHAFVDVRIGSADNDTEDTNQKNRVLYLGIGHTPDGKAMFSLAVTPLGTLLPKGLIFKVDENKEFGGAFAFCMPTGCQSDILLDDGKLKQLRAGSNLKITYTDIRRGPVEIPVALDGISAALNSLPKP